MRVIGMMRIKDEARWIERVIHSILPVCEQVYIWDDHSSDGTPEICEKIEKVTVIRSTLQGIEETRDKNRLIEHVERFGADWILHIDGDEEIESGGCDRIRLLVDRQNGPECYKFQVLYLWDRMDQIRIDGIYAHFSRPSLFRLHPGARFKSNCPGGFHCGNVPSGSVTCSECDVRILHYGYMHREDRIKKWNWYNSIDPQNKSEGYDPRFPQRRSYPHMVQGDVPEIPLGAVTMHAGPLKLAQFRPRS